MASRVGAEKSWLARSSPSIASLAYTVSPPYSAAIRVAANRLVSAAPPTNSGISMAAARRSCAVTTICWADFTSRPDSPKASGLCVWYAAIRSSGGTLMPRLITR